MLEYLKKPTEFGSVTPSSDELAKAMLEGLDLENARTVLEYGPGNGIITDHIRQRIAPETQFEVKTNACSIMPGEIGQAEIPILNRLKDAFQYSDSRGIAFSALND